MTAWHWLAVGLAALGTAAAALYGLHHLALWLEGRGWLYYRTKPGSSPAGRWVGLQQLVEPGVQHVREVGQGRVREDEKGQGERLLGYLADCLAAAVVRPEEVRLYLDAAQRAGLDWRGLYAEAVRRHLADHPGRAALMPPPQDVAPGE
jgi:hypothetical protein